jgi:hypothetical protein
MLSTFQIWIYFLLTSRLIGYRCFLWNELTLITNSHQSVTSIKGITLLMKMMGTPCRESVSRLGTCVTTPELGVRNVTPVHIAVTCNLCRQITYRPQWVPQSDILQLFDVIESSWGFMEFIWWSVASWLSSVCNLLIRNAKCIPWQNTVRHLAAIVHIS